MLITFLKLGAQIFQDLKPSRSSCRTFSKTLKIYIISGKRLRKVRKNNKNIVNFIAWGNISSLLTSEKTENISYSRTRPSFLHSSRAWHLQKYFNASLKQVNLLRFALCFCINYRVFTFLPASIQLRDVCMCTSYNSGNSDCKIYVSRMSGLVQCRIVRSVTGGAVLKVFQYSLRYFLLPLGPFAISKHFFLLKQFRRMHKSFIILIHIRLRSDSFSNH